MAQEIDISWHVLRRIVREWMGTAAELAEVTPLAGGCINTTLALTLADRSRAVLKISAHRVDRSYEREAHQLAVLRNAGVPTPDVFACKVGTLDDPFSYILMEFVEGVDWSHARRAASPEAFDGLQAELADLLLKVHATTGGHYGRITPDDTPRYQNWPEFYRTVFDPVWQQFCQSKALAKKSRKLVQKVHDKLDRLIAHDDVPRLVHSDVWATNLLTRPDGDGRWHVAAVLDPNCKFAHHESELAYLELFQTVGPAFMKAYQRDRRLPSEYHRARKPVYQLYSLLDHAHLHGRKCAQPLDAALERVAALV